MVNELMKPAKLSHHLKTMHKDALVLSQLIFFKQKLIEITVARSVQNLLLLVCKGNISFLQSLSQDYIGGNKKTQLEKI
jgi:hypothetical protein